MPPFCLKSWTSTEAAKKNIFFFFLRTPVFPGVKYRLEREDFAWRKTSSPRCPLGPQGQTWPPKSLDFPVHEELRNQVPYLSPFDAGNSTEKNIPSIYQPEGTITGEEPEGRFF